MADIETLTDEERREVAVNHEWLANEPEPKPEGEKALRIIDAQEKRIAELEAATAIVNHDADEWIKAAQMRANELRVARGRIAELEAKLEGFQARGGPCPRCNTPLSMCAKHGPFVRTDENVCPACRRGE